MAVNVGNLRNRVKAPDEEGRGGGGGGGSTGCTLVRPMGSEGGEAGARSSLVRLG